MYSLELHPRVLESTAANGLMNLTQHAPNWRRSIRAVGGFWTGDFTITPETMSERAMMSFYQSHIGRRIIEHSYGLVSWEGEIIQMDLAIGSVQYTTSLNTSDWANKIQVRYGPSTDDQTAWGEQTGSSDVYGESCLIDVVSGQYTSTSADARRDRLLVELAYPRSHVSGALEQQPIAGPMTSSLRVMCAGYVFSMNRRYQTADIAAAGVSTQIGTVVGNSEFVTAGRIDTNAMSVPVSATGINMRLWDTVEDLIGMGDASGNRWAGGCWENRLFHYHLAETTVTHYWNNSTLYDRGGHHVIPTLIKPDIVVHISGAPGGAVPPGGADIDDPRNVYIEEVEFTAPSGYRLIPRIR